MWSLVKYDKCVLRMNSKRICTSDCRDLTSFLKCDARKSGLRGNVFELVSLAILCGGGQFDIRNLKNSTLTLPKIYKQPFDSLKSIAFSGPSKLFTPTSNNFGAFDALCST